MKVLLTLLTLFVVGLLLRYGAQYFISSSSQMSQISNPRYMMYDEQNIANLTGNIVLFFHADRCPTCQQARKDFLSQQIPDYLTIIEVDYDHAIDLRKKYSVLTQTTYVLINPDGTMIGRRVGGTRLSDVLDQVHKIKSKTHTSSSNLQGSGVYTSAIFAGGCFRCMEGPFESLDGVSEVINGYIGGDARQAQYDIISMGLTKHREAVKVIYDPTVIAYTDLLDVYRRQIDPIDDGGQFADRGYQYTPAIYYSGLEQQTIAQDSLSKLDQSDMFDQKIVVEILPVSDFYPAEEYHQNYYRTQSDNYLRYKKGSGREDYIHKVRGDQKSDSYLPRDRRPPKTIDDLTVLQKKILFEGATETPFDNPYRNNHATGIYVDVIDGTPLFSSLDKFDSQTGWPSFTKPISVQHIGEHTDRSLGISRTELKSNSSSGHLGHVFDDGPIAQGGMRYCINSAALEFIPIDQMESRGYRDYMSLFE